MKTNLKISTSLLAVALIGAATFSACKKENSSSPSNTNGTYNMYMTDAPAIYQQVNVNVIGAQVNTQGGWVSLSVKTGIYNLLDFYNGHDTLIATGSIPSGNINQVRLILDSTGNTVMLNNVLYPLQTPSAQQSGLKINANYTITAGGICDIVIDFDAGRSVVATGTGTYILKPVIRSNANNGTIQGTITPIVAQYPVMAISSANDTATTMSSVINGGFQIQNLPSGTYTVVITPPSPYSIQTFTGVSVNGGHVTNMGKITLY